MYFIISPIEFTSHPPFSLSLSLLLVYGWTIAIRSNQKSNRPTKTFQIIANENGLHSTWNEKQTFLF